MKPIHPEARTRITAGEPLKAGNRTLFPVAKVTILSTEMAILGIIVAPLAIIVVEKRDEYLVSLTGETMTLKTLMQMEPSLRAVVDKAMRIHRIKVT
jgi:uncharacterized spore protein YtfJ